jgi:glycosyltransferase involved in cell wall biosynthesis
MVRFQGAQIFARGYGWAPTPMRPPKLRSSMRRQPWRIVGLNRYKVFLTAPHSNRANRLLSVTRAAVNGKDRAKVSGSFLSKIFVMHIYHTNRSMLQMTPETAARATEEGRALRILQVVPTYFPAVRYGGPIRSVHSLGKALVERGHEVHVFTSSVDGSKDLDVPLGVPVNLDGVLVRYFPVRFLRRLYWCPSLAHALRKDIGSFDLVHLQSIFLWPTWAAARIAKRAGIPYVVSPRGMLGTVVIRRKSRLVKMAWIRLIEQRTLRDSAALHVTAELEREEIHGLGLRTPMIHCIPNGVSWPTSYATLAAGPFCDVTKPYALFLSRIDAKKGLDRLIAAWKWVPDVTLIIAGNDESGYREKLERIAVENEVHLRIRFIGIVSDDHKWALYENATVFILPSYSENFGNVVAEAMALACPVIVTPEVGLANLVRESGAGVVVDGTPRILAEAIRALLQDSTKRRLMGERGRITARQQLSWNSVAARMESVYQEIARAKVAATP